MELPNKISDIKPYQKPHDSIFSTLITRHISRIFSYYFIKWDKRVTPNKVSLLSLVVAILACIFFFYSDYWWRVLGVALLQISFALDCSDGEIARFKNMKSEFGAWFDSASDRFKEILMFSGLTYLAYLKYLEIYVIIIGAVCIIFWLLVAYLRDSKKADTKKAEVYITKTIYIGTVDVTIFLVSIAVIFKIELYILLLFLIISWPLILKQVYSAYNRKSI